MGILLKNGAAVKAMFKDLLHCMSRPNIAVDLGTANTRIYSSLNGETTDNPSSMKLVVRKTVPVSDEYFQYINNKISTKPLRRGVIVDLKNATLLLKKLVNTNRKALLSPMALATAPIGTTEKERDLLRKALINAGTSHVAIIPESRAAAIGAGMDPTLPHAQMLLDIGDGVTEMAVFRGERILYHATVHIACSDLHRSVRSTILARHRVQLESASVEKLTHVIPSMLDEQESNVEIFDISGIDAVQGKRVSCCVNKRDVISAIEPILMKFSVMIVNFLKKLPDKIYYEILESGITLTGGGACIAGMDSLIASRANIKVIVAIDPL
ncbi:rod shape-determining protein, partial [Rhodopseudomonas palustris]|nr:rod shape-determining protein [Rhodopseudomonas palustris]